MDETSVTSAANVPALPDAWTERIFRVMENRYRARWIDSFCGIDRARVLRAWGEELAGFSGEEIARGLAACVKAHPKWPPEVLEFMRLCRPPLDPREAWVEAREQMAVRMRMRGGDRWSVPQVYWAAVAIGNYDLQLLGWEAIRARWERALAEAGSDPVPEFVAPPPALPAPGAQSVARADAQVRASRLVQQVAQRAASEGGKVWALRLLRRAAAGECLGMAADAAWREALGVDKAVPAGRVLADFEAGARA